jgi:hypothetical protein
VPLLSPVVFPLLPINPDGTCGCGDADCGRVGKHPAIAWGEVEAGSPVPLPAPGAGAGIKTGARPRGSGVIVVDLDGPEALDLWFVQKGMAEAEPTFHVHTPRGAHLYYAHPGFPVRNSAGELAPGIDIRGDGGFVVAPGSPHKSGATYEIGRDIDPAPAPEWLLEWLRARAAPAEVQHYPGDVTDEDERAYRRELYTKHLRTTEPCVEGQAGDVRLFEVVQYGAYDLALPVADVLELVHTHFNPRCQPPWGADLDERVIRKARDAKTTSTRERAEPMPRDLAHLVLEPPPLPLPEPGKRRPRSGIVWGGWDEEPEPVDYLVSGLIPVSTVGMFVAMGSSLKTWTALDIARQVSKGAPWLDRFDTKQGRALVIDFESGMYELRRRIHLLEGGEVTNLGAWCYPDGHRIDSPEFWKEVAKIDDLRFVVIDSLAAGAPGVDENDTNVAMPLKLAARFTEAGNAVVLFIHHSRKDEGGDDRKAVRGSTAIYADCDWAYKFDNVEETPAYRRMLMTCIKPCMGPKPDPVRLALTDKAKLVWFEDGDKPTVAPTDNSSESIQAAIRLVLSGGSQATKHAIARAVGKHTQIVTPEIEALLVREEIVKLPAVGYSLDDPARRAARVLTMLAGYDKWKSEDAIAKAAHVDVSVVRTLVQTRRISRSADGRWLIHEVG